jgi:uncharacterized protein (TIGR03435 family)
MGAKLIATALLCIAAQGQTAMFEVASVKTATPLGPMGMRSNRKGGPGSSDPTMYVCENCPVYWVVSEAYDVQPFEFEGPDWLQNVRFDFAAKVPPGTTKAAFRIMLQNLLAERFKMAAHREKKAMGVYELTVAKNGPRLRESAPKDAPQAGGPPEKVQRDRDGFPILGPGMTMAAIPGHARIGSDNQTMAWLAKMLTGQLQSPVIDATGLTAKYDFLLSWAFEDNSASDGAAALDAYRPALISAVQSQLGLKLGQKKGQVEVLVVDHIEKAPTEN